MSRTELSFNEQVENINNAVIDAYNSEPSSSFTALIKGIKTFRNLTGADLKVSKMYVQLLVETQNTGK